MKETFKVVLVHGGRRVINEAQGLRLPVPGLAVINHPEGPVVLLHLASGLSVGQFDDAEQAAHVAFLISDMDDWTQQRPRVTYDLEVARSVSAAVRGAGGRRFGTAGPIPDTPINQAVPQ